MRLFLLALFLGISSILLAQSNNPFDLKYRKPKPIESPAPVKPSITTDTIRETTSTINQHIEQADTNRTVNSITATPSKDSVSKSSNPFELRSGNDVNASKPVTAIEKDTAATSIKSIVPKGLIKNSSKGFQIFFLLLSLLFLIFIVNVERNFVRDLWRVISNENYSSLHHRNQRNTMRQILLLMGYAVFIFQGGIFVYHALRIFNYGGPIILNIWIPMLVIFGIYVIRHLSIRYLRWLFNNQKEMTLFGFDISIFNTMVGLILLPINVLLLFGPESMNKPLIIIGLLAFVAAYSMRQLRWMLTAGSLIAHSLFLFFVYLCAIEILPLWALSKIFW